MRATQESCGSWGEFTDPKRGRAAWARQLPQLPPLYLCLRAKQMEVLIGPYVIWDGARPEGLFS